MIYKLQGGNTLPSLLSILLLLRREGKRNEPKEDAWKKEKERVLKLTDKIKQENSWMGKTADVLHHTGVGATGLGLLGSFIAAPAATALGLIGGIAGEQAVNKATKKVSNFLTNGKGKTWNEYAELLGLSPTLAAITNPGGWIGGLGARAGNKLAGKYEIDRSVLSSGIKLKEKEPDPETKNLILNIVRKLDRAKLLNNEVEIEALKNRLEPFLSKKDRDYLADNAMFFLKGEPAVVKTVNRALVKGKGKRGFNQDILNAKDEAARTSEDQKALQLLYNDIVNGREYKQLNELDAALTKQFDASVKWNWFDGGILAEDNIPANMAVLPAYVNGVKDSKSIMSRFLKNMNSELIQETFLRLVKNRILKTIGHLWVTPTKNGTSYEVVDPTRLVLNELLKQAGSPNRIDYILRQAGHGGYTTDIPWHGTNLSGKHAINAYTDPTRTRPLFTSKDNGKPGYSNVKTAYGTAAKLPMMKTSYERPVWEAQPGASHNSNNYDGKGELFEYFKGNGSNKAREVIDVSDARDIPNNNGLPLDEYNFGLHTPDVKSLFNTFNFVFDKNGKLITRGGAFTMKHGGLINTIINYGRKDNKRTRSI